MSAGPGISAVVVYHDRPDSIGGTLRALQAQERALDRIVVVDNGSKEALVPPQGASVVRLEQPTGLSAARNAGLQAVDSELALVLDDDVYLAPECVKQMASKLQTTGAVLVCPRMILHPDDAIIQCDGAFIHFAGMLGLRHRGMSRREKDSGGFPTTGFIGACVLVQRQMLLELGGFDEDYFFYMEDMELSYRLTALGKRVWCEPGAVAFHDRGAGTRELSYRGIGTYPPRRAYFTLRNRWLTILLHYQWRTLALLAPAFAAYELAALVECIRRGWLGQWLAAARSLGAETTSVLRRRKKWIGLRRVSDREILEGGALPFAEGFVSGALSTEAIRLLDRLLNWYWGFVHKWL